MKQEVDEVERKLITSNVEGKVSRVVTGEDGIPLNADKYEVMSVAPLSTARAHQLREHDGRMQALIEARMKGWPRNKTNLQQELQEYFDVRDELSVEDGIVMKGLLTSEQSRIPTSRLSMKPAAISNEKENVTEVRQQKKKWFDNQPRNEKKNYKFERQSACRLTRASQECATSRNGQEAPVPSYSRCRRMCKERNTFC